MSFISNHFVKINHFISARAVTRNCWHNKVRKNFLLRRFKSDFGLNKLLVLDFLWLVEASFGFIIVILHWLHWLDLNPGCDVIDEVAELWIRCLIWNLDHVLIVDRWFWVNTSLSYTDSARYLQTPKIFIIFPRTKRAIWPNCKDLSVFSFSFLRFWVDIDILRSYLFWISANFFFGLTIWTAFLLPKRRNSPIISVFYPFYRLSAYLQVYLFAFIELVLQWLGPDKLCKCSFLICRIALRAFRHLFI